MSCKKNEGGPNTINYSLDGGPVRNCTGEEMLHQFLGGPTCGLTVQRQGHAAFGEAASITIFTDSDCNLTSGPLPYTTTKFSVGIWDNNDQTMSPQISPYTYPDSNPNDSASGQLLTLMITFRQNNRIKGTISGKIFGGDYHDPKLKTLKCDFDIAVPFK